MRAKIKFEPITPVMIGSGEEYYPQDFFIVNDDIYFIDQTKFYKKIEQKNLLEEFMKASEDIYDLLEFIDKHADPNIAKQKIAAETEVLDDLDENYSRPIKEFVKEKFIQTPIIPGSSIKGAIRTAILDYIVAKNGVERFENMSAKQIESLVFCGSNRFDAKKDMLKALFVDDLEPKNYQLKAIKPLNRPFKKPKDNKIPLILEALIDGEFEGEIRIDRNLLRNDESLRNNRYFQDEPLSIELIKKALKNFYEKIATTERKRFRAYTPLYEEYMIKIGQHTGAGSKSLNKLRQIYIREIRKKFDYQLSIWIDKDECALGWAKLEFE